jgi:hypothetical protein
MAESFREQVRAILEGGGGEALGDGRFLPLITLESEARLGLDASGVWTVVPTDGRAAARCTPGNEHMLYEVFETKRSDFEEKLAKAAAAAGLPGEETMLAFPATAVVRAVLDKEQPYLTRLALQWLVPTELREMRDAIVKVTKNREIPKVVKDLAARLIVPE